MVSERKGWSRSRPLRVAFLVQEGEHANLALDGIIADCYNRWGGRFSLIVPCANRQITPSYWPWLEAYDPDIIYSYVPLNQADILEVHERLYPSEYIFHEMGREPRLNVHGFKPDYKFTPLSSLSIIFRLARYSSAAVNKIVDFWPSEQISSFWSDNFGSYFISRSNSGFPTDAKNAASILTIIDSEKLKDRRSGIPRDLDTVPNEMAAFIELTKNKAISMSILSTRLAPRLEVRVRGWSESFNLVVGNTYADRLLHWNARLLLPSWLDTDINCLRVGLDQLKDAAFLESLGEYLKQRNRVNNGSGGQPQITIRSMSLSQEQIDEAKSLISSTKPWGFIDTKIITSFDEIVPPKALLKPDDMLSLGRLDDGLFSQSNWMPFSWIPPFARPPSNIPDHITDAPPRQYFTEGFWMTDFSLEQDGPRPKFTNENRWILPHRWRMARAFEVSRTDTPRHALPPMARTNRSGNLSIGTSEGSLVEKINIPTSYEAIRYALTRDGERARSDAEHGAIQPPVKTYWMRLSNEARYLNGVWGLCGGLRKASLFLLHPFLMDFFAKLGGSPNIDPIKITPTIDRLRKRAQLEASFDLRDEAERKTLANLIVKASNSLKRPMNYIKYNQIKDDWKLYRENYWVNNPLQGTPDPDIDWSKNEEESLDQCLVEMRSRQILFQGHQWTCPKCHHKNWVDMSSLASSLSCEVCKRAENSPVNISWLFRPSEFLIESLRDHSVLSLVWVLSIMSNKMARNSLIFAEPSWFDFAPDAPSPNAEADLLAVIDGKAVVFEVKSSWTELRLPRIANFINLTRRLRPDVAILAVMDRGVGPASELETAKSTLAAEGIKFEWWTLDKFDLEDEPEFRFYEE